jgi:hypothetical protein
MAMLTNTVEREPIAPAEDELADLVEVNRLIRDAESGSLKLVGRAGQAVELTESAVRVLRQAIDALAKNRVVEVKQLSRDLPSPAAAELLGVTHGYMLGLLDQGVIPSNSAYGVPRVRFEDLMAYKRVRDAERRRILDEMTQESQELEALRTGSL